MKKAILQVLDEVNVKFKDVDPATRRKLHNTLAFFKPGAQYQHAYRLGRWDGKKHFCSVGGNTFLNLLDYRPEKTGKSLVDVLTDSGYEIEVDDLRKTKKLIFPTVDENFLGQFDIKWPSTHQKAGEIIKLFDHQVKVINKFFQHNQCIQEVPTGAGKTVTTAVLALCASIYGRVLIIVPSKSLVKQTMEDFELIGLDAGVYYGDKKEFGKTHTIATWQGIEALKKKDKKMQGTEFAMLLDDVQCVIVDECHSAKADVLRDLLSGPLANCPLRWGLTGTVPPEEYNHISLVASIGPVISSIEITELQDKGVLAKCMINIVQTPDDVVFSDYHSELSYLISDKKRMNWLAKYIQEQANTGNTLVLVNYKKTGKALEKIIPGSVFISGEDKADQRKIHYDSVRTENNKVLIATYGVAAVGINMPRIFHLVLVEAGKGFIRTVQSIGRSIRVAKDKDHAEVHDICSKAKYSNRHKNTRRQWYDRKGLPYKTIKIKYEDWALNEHTDSGELFVLNE